MANVCRVASRVGGFRLVLQALSWLPVFALLSASAHAQQPPAAVPVITFEHDAVIVSGITHGGSVAWFGIGHAHEEDALHVVTRNAIGVDDDKDGAVRFEVDREVPQQSVWIAVDMETGQLAVESPAGYALRLVNPPADSIQLGAGGIDELHDPHHLLRVLVVRPHAGAWAVDVGDGGTRDLDGEANGQLILTLDKLVPFEGSPEFSPAALAPGDVVAAIAIDSLETYAVRLATAPKGKG